MSDRFFLDTNIFVYSFDQIAARKSRVASDLIRKAIATQKGIISYQVVQEFFNVALKKFAEPMNSSEAEQYQAKVFLPLLGVHSSPSLFSGALILRAQSRLSWYDSLIVTAAIQSRCDVLYSEDLQHGQKFGNLRIANPFL